MCEIVRDTCTRYPRGRRAVTIQGSQLNRSFACVVAIQDNGGTRLAAVATTFRRRTAAEVSVQQFLCECCRAAHATHNCALTVRLPCSVAMKPSKMIGGDYSLELNNIFHTGQVEPASCFQRLFGSVQTGLILKDITLEVRAGEVMAILGSKGKTLVYGKNRL